MKLVLIQLWENFENNLHQSDGCSLHLDLIERNRFERLSDLEHPVGFPSEVSIQDSIYNILKKEKSIRLTEIEMNNLLGLKDIITNDF
jgi:hypothetical protein